MDEKAFEELKNHYEKLESTDDEGHIQWCMDALIFSFESIQIATATQDQEEIHISTKATVFLLQGLRVMYDLEPLTGKDIK